MELGKVALVLGGHKRAFVRERMLEEIFLRLQFFPRFQGLSILFIGLEEEGFFAAWDAVTRVH